MVFLRALLSLRVCERIEHESWTHGFPVFRRQWGERAVSTAVRLSQRAVFQALKHTLTAALGPLAINSKCFVFFLIYRSDLFALVCPLAWYVHETQIQIKPIQSLQQRKMGNRKTTK